MSQLIVVPAYGRDYKAWAEAVWAWQNGQDFKIMDLPCSWNGMYANIKDVTAEYWRYTSVKIRFNQLADWVIVDNGGKVVGSMTGTSPENKIIPGYDTLFS